MLTFVIWVIFISVGICALVMLALLAALFISVVELISRATNKHALPDPDKASERMYGQKYFVRAIGKK